MKVDLLARKLAVTRGSFYHCFEDKDGLLRQLLAHWEARCRFLPEGPLPTCPEGAISWLHRMGTRLIEGDGYDAQFDLAVREWGRSDKRVAYLVERVDGDRLTALQRTLDLLSYDEAASRIRARVFYYHQIGYYAIGVRERAVDRRRTLPIYMDILWGEGWPGARLQRGSSGVAKKEDPRS